MKKLLMVAGVAALCAPLAANANYNLSIEDEMRLFINSGECNVDAATPLFVTLGITTVAEGENAGERQLNLVLSGDDAETLDCFEFDAGAGSDPNVHSVVANAGANGSISPAGEVYVYTNQRLSFDLLPAGGYIVNSASGCGGTLSSNGNVYTTGPVTSSCNVNVSFQLAPTITHSVTASAGTGGSISPSNRTVAEGGSTSFTLTPDDGYEVGSVSGCGGTRSGLTYNISNVTSNCSVSVSFNPIGGGGNSCLGDSYNGPGTIDCLIMNQGWGAISTQKVRLNSSPRIYPFVATQASTYEGTLGVVMDGSSGSRQVWISNTPGGSHLPNQDKTCYKSGAEISVSWAHYPVWNKCSLVSGNTYYLHMTHGSCSNSSGCGAKWTNYAWN